MLHASVCVKFLWIASPVVQLGVAAVMARKRLHREFPFFFSYTIFRSSTALLMFVLFERFLFDGNLYSYVNSIHEIGCIILRFAVIYEAFTVLLKNYPALRDSVGSFFRWATAALLIFAVIVALIHKWGPYTARITAGLNLVDRTVDIVQCGLLLALLVFSRYLRLSWRSYGFGIAIGLGIFASVDLATAAILLETGQLPMAQQIPIAAMMSLISMAAYLLSVLVWFVYALIREPEQTIVDKLPEHDLAAWNDELERLLQR